MKHICALLTALLAITCGSSAADGPVPPTVAEQPVQGVLSAVSHPSIQAALDANPGRMVYVPSGDYSITRRIVLNKDRSGLFGPGRIIQQTADEPALEIENASSIMGGENRKSIGAGINPSRATPAPKNSPGRNRRKISEPVPLSSLGERFLLCPDDARTERP